jgi:glutamine--fructose-6-phosphate transaminase (EC 2.6.1.16)
MCGIVGIAARSGALGEPLGLAIYRCLKSLEYRGYDSIGYAVVRVDGSLIVRKSRGKIDEVFERLGFARVDGLVGIGHTSGLRMGDLPTSMPTLTPMRR